MYCVAITPAGGHFEHEQRAEHARPRYGEFDPRDEQVAGVAPRLDQSEGAAKAVRLSGRLASIVAPGHRAPLDRARRSGYCEAPLCSRRCGGNHVEPTIAIGVLTKLIGLGMKGWSAVESPGFDEKDVAALQTLLETTTSFASNAQPLSGSGGQCCLSPCHPGCHEARIVGLIPGILNNML